MRTILHPWCNAAHYALAMLLLGVATCLSYTARFLLGVATCLAYTYRFLADTAERLLNTGGPR